MICNNINNNVIILIIMICNNINNKYKKIEYA